MCRFETDRLQNLEFFAKKGGGGNLKGDLS
nr:MAG TPA: hypothetical protein [Caudoviricetes sp.]